MEERKTIYLCLAHMSEEGWEQKYVKEAIFLSQVNQFKHLLITLDASLTTQIVATHRHHPVRVKRLFDIFLFHSVFAHVS